MSAVADFSHLNLSEPGREQAPIWPATHMKNFAQDTALLFSASAEAEFLVVLRRFLSRLTGFDEFSILCQRETEQPQLVASSFDQSVLRTGMRNYLEETYVLDPFVHAFQKGAPPGAYRGVDVARYCDFSVLEERDLPLRLGFGEEIGFRTHDWPERMSELQVVFPVKGINDEEVCCQIGLYRKPDTPVFNEVETSIVSSLTPIISGAFTQFWRRLVGIEAPKETPAIYDLLSPREREVIQLVTRGYSSIAIGSILEISVETVKTHRKRAYRKLGIASQAELFALIR